MTDVNAIRSNNLLLVNWLNGNDTTPIEQQASSSSNILPEIGMGVAFGLPLVAGMKTHKEKSDYLTNPVKIENTFKTRRKFSIKNTW